MLNGLRMGNYSQNLFLRELDLKQPVTNRHDFICLTPKETAGTYTGQHIAG